MEYYSLLQSFADKLPHFPDGRIDYTGCSEAPVVTVFVFNEGKLLLLRRSGNVATYQGKWNSIAGYLDDPKVTLCDKVLGEVSEEIGIEKQSITDLKVGEPFALFDQEIGKTWHIFPAKVEIVCSEIKLDFEHTECFWIDPKDLKKYDHVYGLEKTLQKVFHF